MLYGNPKANMYTFIYTKKERKQQIISIKILIFEFSLFGIFAEDNVI